MGTLIREKLWLGGAEAAYDTKKLKERGTTHLLTIELSPVREENRSSFTYLFVDAEDSTEEDLLNRFEECIEFIESARMASAGGVLVHCFMGFSRSATIVIAYLMWKEGLTVKEAHQSVWKLRNIGPNPGFMKQLRLFEAMGNKIDPEYADYRAMSLDRLTSKVRELSFGRRKLANFAEEESVSGAAMRRALAADPVDAPTDGLLFRCRKCRRALARGSSLLPHKPGRGKAFGSNSLVLHRSVNGISGDGDQTVCQEGFFFEPVEWMRDQILFLEGKLQCPKESCGAKLGNFNWVGHRCPCDHWVVPAFHLAASKVDKCQPLPLTSHALSDSENAQTV